MVCSRAQEQPSSGQEERPQLLWLAELTGAHIGLAPIPQDAQDRCSIWENLVSLVDFQCPGFPLTSEELCSYIDIPRTPSSSSSSSSSSSVGSVTATLPQAASWPPGLPEDVDYKTNGELKPPYSYSTLIRMAMEASEEPKLTLAAICEWIRDNFCYFRRAHPGWQSSVRHNLCINKRFVKVPREKGEPGRGAFWKLHPRYAQRLKDGTSGGSRTLSDLSIPPASSRRTQHGARRIPSPAASACGLEHPEFLTAPRIPEQHPKSIHGTPNPSTAPQIPEQCPEFLNSTPNPEQHPKFLNSTPNSARHPKPIHSTPNS
ncbi:hypothetical protein DUI87_35443 [Hirundo rustica rustica]|uniref:Forkhead box protein G1 n=1 Tax=Hirundo rustica rustica TaxID=333673 RepID=A0A3M0IIR0_HIRRU|nr:hypothetical protein DUI87_35443 [Hirundo rustica rustica]